MLQNEVLPTLSAKGQSHAKYFETKCKHKTGRKICFEKKNENYSEINSSLVLVSWSH